MNENDASRIKLARELIGVTIGDVSKSTGIPEATIYAYESGKRKVGIEYIKSLYNAFEISPLWILSGAGGVFFHAEKSNIGKETECDADNSKSKKVPTKNLGNSNIAKLLTSTESLVAKWKKEDRPIISLLTKYLSDKDIEEFLKSRRIKRLESDPITSNDFLNRIEGLESDVRTLMNSMAIQAKLS